MNTISIVVNLLLVQGVLGAFDTVFHHELKVALPQQHNSALELRIHALRAVLYGVVFAGLAWFVWGGAWLLVLGIIVLIEVGLTLWDFVVEDRSRLLPASERVLHTVLAMNGGALFGILCLQLPVWWSLPNELLFVSYGWPSWVLSVFAVGVTTSGVRDALASRAVAHRARTARQFDFGAVPQTVLITGGTGFIGQALTRALLAAGHEPILLVRNPLKAAYLFQGRVRSIRSFAELSSGHRVDAVVNLAGERIVGPRWSTRRKQQLLDSRVGTTEQLVKWVARASHKPRLFISASAIGYYGSQVTGDDTALNEQSPAQNDFASVLCQRWEAAARAVEQHGVPLAILRFGLVFGHQGVLPVMRLPFMLGMGGPIGNGRQIMSWVHLDDLLNVIAHLLAAPNGTTVAGTYNVVSPFPVPQREFATTLGKVLHRPSLLPTPAWVLHLLLGEQAQLMTEGQRALPAALLARGHRFLFPDLEAALRDLQRRTP